MYLRALAFFVCSTLQAQTVMTCCHTAIPLTLPQTAHLIAYGGTPDPIAVAAAVNLFSGFTGNRIAQIPGDYYYPPTGAAVTTSITFGVQDNVATNPAYGSSTSIAFGQVPTLLANEIAAGHIPAPASSFTTMYTILPGTGMIFTGLQAGACAQHGVTTIGGFAATIIYVTDLSQVGGCTTGSSVTGDSLATDDANVIWHEIAEGLTYGWSSGGNEIGDQCVWTFGSTQLHNGQPYNQIIGSTYYMLQLMWMQFQFPDPSAGSCQQGNIYPQKTFRSVGIRGH